VGQDAPRKPFLFHYRCVASPFLLLSGPGKKNAIMFQPQPAQQPGSQGAGRAVARVHPVTPF